MPGESGRPAESEKNERGTPFRTRGLGGGGDGARDKEGWLCRAGWWRVIGAYNGGREGEKSAADRASGGGGGRGSRKPMSRAAPSERDLSGFSPSPVPRPSSLRAAPNPDRL